MQREKWPVTFFDLWQLMPDVLQAGDSLAVVAGAGHCFFESIFAISRSLCSQTMVLLLAATHPSHDIHHGLHPHSSMTTSFAFKPCAKFPGRCYDVPAYDADKKYQPVCLSGWHVDPDKCPKMLIVEYKQNGVKPEDDIVRVKVCCTCGCSTCSDGASLCMTLR